MFKVVPYCSHKTVLLLTDASSIWIFDVISLAHEALGTIANLAIAVGAGCQVKHKRQYKNTIP